MAQPMSGNSSGLSILAGTQNGMSEEDARILRGLRAGFEESYEDLIARFEQPIYSMVFRLLGNESDACDVVQEVFLKVFRSVHAFREQSSLRTWIYRIAVNEAHNHRRWFVRHCRLEVSLESEKPDQPDTLKCHADPAKRACWWNAL
jgi:RNA polymerase sigma-70 factor (ECF subfamily)